MTPYLSLPEPEVAEQGDGIDTAQEHPEEIDAQGQPFTDLYGDRFERLPTQLVLALKALVEEFQQQDKYQRRREVLRDRRNRYYERNVQHLYETTQGYSVMLPGQVITTGSGGKLQAPRYIDDYNVFLPSERIIQAVLTQNLPGIKFEPTNKQLSEHQEAAQIANDYTDIFDRSNDVKGLQLEQVRMFCLSGRTVSWTRTVQNAQMFGENPQGDAKRREVTTFHGTLESKVPITAKNQGECLYCFLLDDPDIKQAKSEYPGENAEGQEFAKQIKSGTTVGENEYERNARLGVLQGTRSQLQIGDAFSHLSSRIHAFLRPGSFVGDKFDAPFIEDDAAEIAEDMPTVGDKLKEIFPQGAQVTFVGEVYVGSWDCSMDDCLDIAFPYKGDGMARQAIMDSFVVIQDTFNDVTNAMRQAVDVGWPSTWIDGEEQDGDAVPDQVGVPFAIRIKKARKDMPMAASFFREPDINLPASVLQWIEYMVGPLAQFILATPPALFGGAGADQASKTASGYAQARAQAMGQLALFWSSMQRQWARIRYQSALAAAKNPDYAEEVLIPGQTLESSSFSKMTKGAFGAFPDEDSSFPESTDQKRAVMAQIIEIATKNPGIGSQLMSSPQNWEEFLKLNGLPELVLPMAESYRKQHREIEELLKGKPVVSEQAMMQAASAYEQSAAVAAASGIPAPPFNPQSVPPDQPTIMPGEFDYNAWEFECCKEWLSSDECAREIANGNNDGVQNVTFHTQYHKSAMMTEQAQMAQMQAMAQAPQLPPSAGPSLGPAKASPPTPIAPAAHGPTPGANAVPPHEAAA